MNGQRRTRFTPSESTTEQSSLQLTAPVFSPQSPDVAPGGRVHSTDDTIDSLLQINTRNVEGSLTVTDTPRARKNELCFIHLNECMQNIYLQTSTTSNEEIKSV